VGRRLADAAALQDPAARARAVFGRDFMLLTGFAFPSGNRAAAELQQALAYDQVMLSGQAHRVDEWFAQAARVREPLGRCRLLQMLTRASGAQWPAWRLAQIPHVAGASWVGLPPNANENRAAGTASLALLATSTPLPSATSPWYGLFVDEWAETIPDERQHSAVAFRYDDTGTEAPQCILVCVSPTDVPAWDFDSLAAIVDEALDLAKIRTVDLEQLDPLAQILPGIFLAANAGDETISTPLDGVQDAVILGMEEG
jgi:hypothetical protein